MRQLIPNTMMCDDNLGRDILAEHADLNSSFCFPTNPEG